MPSVEAANSKHNHFEEISGDPEENVFPDKSPTLATYENSQINTFSVRLSSNHEADTSSEFYEPSHLNAQEKVLVNDEVEFSNFSRTSIAGGKVEVKESSINIGYGPSTAAPTNQDYSPQKVKLIIVLIAA